MYWPCFKPPARADWGCTGWAQAAKAPSHREHQHQALPEDEQQDNEPQKNEPFHQCISPLGSGRSTGQAAKMMWRIAEEKNIQGRIS